VPTDLETVYHEISEDPYWDSLRLPGIAFVPGFGCRRPKVLIVGEAPGATENKRLRPFCGPSGQVLAHLMAVAKLHLEEHHAPGCPGTGTEPGKPGCASANAFVTNVLKYRPPSNRTPSVPEIMHAREGYRQEKMVAGFEMVRDERLAEGAGSLRREWAALGKPSVIVCVGSVAHAAFHPHNYEGISRWAGKAVVERKGVRFFSQFHPAYGLRRGPKVQDDMTEDWRRMGDYLREEGLL
jgi:uracil-DNA glycosylase